MCISLRVFIVGNNCFFSMYIKATNWYIHILINFEKTSYSEVSCKTSSIFL